MRAVTAFILVALLPLTARGADALLALGRVQAAEDRNAQARSDDAWSSSQLVLRFAPEADGAVPVTIPKRGLLFQDLADEQLRYPTYELLTDASGVLRVDGSAPVLSLDAQVLIQRTRHSEAELFDVVITAERPEPGGDLEVRVTGWRSGADRAVDRPAFWTVLPGELLGP